MVTDTVYLATEDIVWEALWDQARKLKKRQMEDLEREMGRKKQVDRVMQEEWEILLILLVGSSKAPTNIGEILDFKPDSGSVFHLNPLRLSEYVPS